MTCLQYSDSRMQPSTVSPSDKWNWNTARLSNGKPSVTYNMQHPDTITCIHCSIGGSRGIGYNWGDMKSVRSWEGAMLPPQKSFWILKVKMAHFCVGLLLSIDFKVCRLIAETASDHIRKRVTNRLRFPPLFRASLKGKSQEVLR